MAKREMKTTKKVEENEAVDLVQGTEEKTEPVKAETLNGEVTGCVKLNVRKKPDLKADKVAVIDEKTKVTVHPDESTNDWYKITIGKTIEGFCVKTFIKLKK